MAFLQTVIQKYAREQVRSADIRDENKYISMLAIDPFLVYISLTLIGMSYESKKKDYL